MSRETRIESIMEFEKLTDNSNFGRFQLLHFFLSSITVFMAGINVVTIVFIANKNANRCFVPSCDSEYTSYYEPFLNFTTPYKSEDGRYSLYDGCRMFEDIYKEQDVFLSHCLPLQFDHSTTVNCSKWKYATTPLTSTIVTEFDLVCESSWLVPVAGSSYMLGMLIGSIVIGAISDKYGRKKAVIISAVIFIISGICTAISPNFVLFLIFRMLTGIGGIGLFVISFIIVMELIGSKWRTFCGMMLCVPFALGEATAGIIAYFIRDWRWLQAICTAPAFLLLIYIWILPESVRWLVSENRNKEALKIIERIARVNKLQPPIYLHTNKKNKEILLNGIENGKLHHKYENGNVQGDHKNGCVPGEHETMLDSADYKNLRSNYENGRVSVDYEKVSEKNNNSVIDICRYPNMRKRTLNLFFAWCASTMAYFGLSNYSGNLAGNIFINFILTMFVEVPSCITSYFLLKWVGRKATLSFVLILGGSACIVSAFLSNELSWAILTLSLIGKFGVAASFASLFVYTAELYPTEYRSIGIGACSTCARVGGILAPIIAGLASIYQPLPLLIFGILTLIAGSLMILLPETAGSILPQTLEESEQFGRDQSILHFACFQYKSKSENNE